MENPEYDALTPEEISQGWHHCYSWNGKLIGPGFSEMNSCKCAINKKIHDQIKKNEFKQLQKENSNPFRYSQ